MPRQMPTTPGPRIRAQARGGSLLLTFPIGGRGSRHRRPLPDRPPTLQAFRSVLSETTSVSTRRLIKGSRSYLRRHGVQSRGAAISYHKVALAVYRKFCWRFPNFTLGCRTFATLCAVLEKLRRLMFSLPLHGFALFNHNQETLFCSDYSGLRPIYAAQPHPKTLQPTHV